VSLKRKLLAGAAVFLVAAGVTGAALAASGHGRSVQPAPSRLLLHGTARADFVRATAQYLGTDVVTLRQETKSGRTLAGIANSTPGRSERQLVALLVAAGSSKLQLITDRAMSREQRQALHAMLRHRITGFLNDTCALALGSFAKHLAGCPGMTVLG
jgi:hypothetical protein